MLKDKIQNPSACLFWLFFVGGDVMVQISGDGRFGGWLFFKKKNLAYFEVRVISRILTCWMRGFRLLWTRSSRIPTSRKRSVWRNRKLRKMISSFAEDRPLTWSAATSRLLAAHDTVQWLRWSTCNYSSQWCSRSRYDTGWSSTVSKVPSDDVLESLYELRIRESDQLKTVLVHHQRSPHALKFEDETERQERCARGDAWRLAKNILKAQRKWQSYLFLTYQRMVAPSAIRDKTGGKSIRCRFQSVNAHVEQERPERCRIWQP